MKKAILLLLLSICMISAAHALENDFLLEYSAVNNAIYINESAVFTIKLTNNMATDASFAIYPGQVEWDVTTEPAEDKVVRIAAGKSKTVVVKLKPTVAFLPNLYGSVIKVRNLKTNEVKANELIITVKGDPVFAKGSYLPAVKTIVTIPEQTAANENIVVKVRLENQNRRNISELSISLKSSLFNKEYFTDLEGLEKKDLEFAIAIDPLTDPQESELNVDVMAMDNDTMYVFKAPTEVFSISAYGGITKEESTDETFLRSIRTVTLSNEGNMVRPYEFRVKKNFFDGLFFSSEPDAVKSKGVSQTDYTWSGSLGKTGSQTITIVYNYTWLYILILIAIIIVAAYYIFRSGIIIAKSASITARSEGGISELAIKVHLKNRTNRTLYDVEVRDKVPNLLDVKHEFAIGTLQPSNILRHDKRGSIVKWVMPELEPFEERILSYKVKAKLSILGDFSLPETVVKYKTNKLGSSKFSDGNIVRMNYK